MAHPMNPASITWPEHPAAMLFIDPPHPGAGRYDPPLPAPKLPDGFSNDPDPDDKDWEWDWNYVGSKWHY